MSRARRRPRRAHARAATCVLLSSLWLLALACSEGERTPAAAASPASSSETSTALAAPPSSDPVELRLVVYNVHGLPAWLAFDDPAARMPVIGEKLARFDVALLQEDWAHHAALVAAAGARGVLRGNGPREARFAGLAPLCGQCGSGLTTLVWAGAGRVVEQRAAPLPGCSGWIAGGGDCFATKGFLRARIAPAPGLELDLVNLHLDAGTGAADQRVRAEQLRALAEELERTSAGRALVVAGDFNLDLDEPDSFEILDSFRVRLGLNDAGARPARSPAQGGAWRRLDHVLVRSGARVRLDVLEAGELADAVHAGRPLSDHPAVFARLRLASE